MTTQHQPAEAAPLAPDLLADPYGVTTDLSQPMPEAPDEATSRERASDPLGYLATVFVGPLRRLASNRDGGDGFKAEIASAEAAVVTAWNGIATDMATLNEHVRGRRYLTEPSLSGLLDRVATRAGQVIEQSDRFNILGPEAAEARGVFERYQAVLSATGNRREYIAAMDGYVTELLQLFPRQDDAPDRAPSAAQLLMARAAYGLLITAASSEAWNSYSAVEDIRGLVERRVDRWLTQMGVSGPEREHVTHLITARLVAPRTHTNGVHIRR